MENPVENPVEPQTDVNQITLEPPQVPIQEPIQEPVFFSTSQTMEGNKSFEITYLHYTLGFLTALLILV